VNQVGHVFSMADVQRQYDPFLPASEAEYGLQQFFLNGGTEAYIVRVAAGSPAQVAAIDLAPRFSRGRHPVPPESARFRTTKDLQLRGLLALVMAGAGPCWAATALSAVASAA